MREVQGMYLLGKSSSVMTHGMINATFIISARTSDNVPNAVCHPVILINEYNIQKPLFTQYLIGSAVMSSKDQAA